MEGRTVFNEILDFCDPAKLRGLRRGEPPTALDRQTLIGLSRDDHDPESGVRPEHRLPSEKAIDRLLKEPEYVPEDETIRRLAGRLQPAFRGDEDLLLLLRRRYAIVAAARQVKKLVGAEPLGHLAAALGDLVKVLLDPRLDPPNGPARDRRLAILVLLGAASPDGRNCMRSLGSRTGGLVNPDLLALAAGQEGRRIAECTWIVSQWSPGPGQREEDFHEWLRVMLWQGREELKASVASAPWPDETSREVTLHGLLYIVAVREEQWGEAEGHLAAGLAADPGNLTLTHWRLRLRLSRRDYDGAGEDAKAIRALDPQNPAVHVSLAETLVREGATRTALECLDCVRGPDKIAAVYMAHLRGLAHWQLQDFRRALDAFKNVLECQKDHPEAHAYAADCYYRLGEPRKGAEHESKAQNLGASELLDALRRGRMTPSPSSGSS
jgi:tetratricopeptide (TPR) repeat protein